MKKLKTMVFPCLVMVLVIVCMGSVAFGQASGKPSRMAVVYNTENPGETALVDGRDETANVNFIYNNGTPVTIYDDYSDGWSRVGIGNGAIEGYIRTEWLLDDLQDVQPFEVPVVLISNIAEDGVVNLRELPMVESQYIDQYPLGQEGIGLGMSEKWYHVSIDENIGFMDTTYLLKTEKTAEYQGQGTKSEVH